MKCGKKERDWDALESSNCLHDVKIILVVKSLFSRIVVLEISRYLTMDGGEMKKMMPHPLCVTHI